MRKPQIIAGILLIATLLVLGGCAPKPASTPPPSLQFATSGTVLIIPGDAEGFSLDDTGVVAYNCHIKFTNNVPYSVDVHVVREMYPYESKPNATCIENYFKDVVTSTSGKSGELVVGIPFLRPPYTIWFVNNTSNTDFEVEYEVYWE